MKNYKPYSQIRLLYSYVCENCEKEAREVTIVKASAPASIMKRSLTSIFTVVHVIYQKYVNEMPLYRQDKD